MKINNKNVLLLGKNDQAGRSETLNIKHFIKITILYYKAILNYTLM